MMAKQPPWEHWPLGARVVVRRDLPGGYSDVVGILEERLPHLLRVRNRHGELVEIPTQIIAVGKVISPPAPEPES